MKNVLVALLTFAVSAGASANISNVEFRALDQSAETQMCVAAAQGGMPAAKAVATELGIKFNEAKRSTFCNDQGLVRFASKFTAKTETTEKVSVAKRYVTADNSQASEICKYAVDNGLSKASMRFNVKDVYCNGEYISRFVKKQRG